MILNRIWSLRILSSQVFLIINNCSYLKIVHVTQHLFWHEMYCYNKPFRVPLHLFIKTRLRAQPLIWKSFFVLVQIKLIFKRKVVHLASFWKWGFLELASYLVAYCFDTCFYRFHFLRLAWKKFLHLLGILFNTQAI